MTRELQALEALLARRDPRDLRRRGHRITHVGKASRFLTTWLPAARAYVEYELARRIGSPEGWQSARTQRIHVVR